MKAIFERELKSYFTSMIAPLFIAVMTCIMGIYFMAYNMNYGYPYFSYSLSAILFIFTFSIPILTMRSMSEERRQKTDQLLLTSPISVTQMVMGKYLALVAVLAIPCLIFCLCPLIIDSTGTAYLAVDYSSILAFFLTGCVYIAIGMLISSMTESIILAAVGSIGALIFLNFLVSLASFMPSAAFPSLIGCIVILTIAVIIIHIFGKNAIVSGTIEMAGIAVMTVIYLINPDLYENCIPQLMEQLAVTEVFYQFSSEYIFDIAGIVKLLSAAGVCVFLTVQTVQKRRWS